MEERRHYGFLFNVAIKNASGDYQSLGDYEDTQYKDFMFSLKMMTFSKSLTCPSSESLLAFQKGEASILEKSDIRYHLEVCEFCSAEVEFYEHNPQSDEVIGSTEIPVPLFQLAEALLRNGHKDFSQLNKLLNETDGLSLKKA